MMQSNLEYARKEKNRKHEFDQSFNHLINPIEFQLMDKKEAARYKVSRQKKKKDDEQNLRYI